MRQKHIILWIMLGVILIGVFWESAPVIKNTVHSIFDPTLGKFLDWNMTWAMLILVAIINLIMTLVQKYTTDQETLKEIKKEQKAFQKEMKKYKDDPGKIMELNKKNFNFMKQTFVITTQSWIFTMIPIVLLFRWFHDYFGVDSLKGFKFFGIFSWFWFYLVVSIVFTSIFRKVFDVA